MSPLWRTDQGSVDPRALTHRLETTFLECVRQGRAHWLPEVREALEMLEIAEENAGFRHVRVLKISVQAA